MERLAKPGSMDKAGSARRRLPGVLGWVVGVGAGLFAFVLYLLTLAPTVLYYTNEMKDSAVLSAVAYTLGISHPTGYPTYTILTYLFAHLLPFGDVAYRTNLASAVFGASAVAALYRLGLRLGRSIVAALAGALTFGVSPLFWSQAVIVEVYTLHILFLATTLLVLLLWRDTRRDRYLLLAAFLIGLAMTHHLTSGLLLPTAAVFVLVVDAKKVLDWKVVLKSVGLFLLPLTLYAYLPLRARMHPALNVEDPSTWERFENMVTGGDFKARMWVFGPEELPHRFESLYLDHISGQFHWAFLTVALIGVLYTLLRDRQAFALLAVPFGGFLLYSLEYDIEDIHYYFIPTYAILSAWASVGLAEILRGAGKEAGRLRTTPGLRAAVVVALSVFVLSMPLWGLSETYKAVDKSGDYEGRRIVDTVATRTAPNAIVIQHRGPLAYMQLVEGRRRDIKLWSFAQPSGPKETAEAVAAIRQGRLYILNPNEAKTRQFEAAGYKLVPVQGKALYRVTPANGA